jgi:nicotinate-nucleotide adenylyltransferase
MRTGVFGGTFDPIHVGHLILAEQCREQANLDEVLFVPAALPPHKQQQALTSFAQRVEMLALALSGHAPFRVEEMEKERSGPSYTVDTLTQLHAQRPGDEICFIIGSDSLHDLPIWYQPSRILELATLLVVARADWPVFAAKELKDSLQLDDDFPLRYQVVEAPLITIASRDVRRRIAAGRSVRYMIPRAVEAYIEDKRLYRDKKNAVATS